MMLGDAGLSPQRGSCMSVDGWERGIMPVYPCQGTGLLLNAIHLGQRNASDLGRSDLIFK